MKKAVIIGSGFAGLSAACCMAKAGWDVTVLEKQSTPGGRARQLKEDGFTFDMGPSWYWMPDVFENYFKEFNTTVAQHYELLRLDPSYAVFFSKEEVLRIPANLHEFYQLFEKHEPGSSVQLKKFLADAEYKYNVSKSVFVHKPSLSIFNLRERKKFSMCIHLQCTTRNVK